MYSLKKESFILLFLIQGPYRGLEVLNFVLEVLKKSGILFHLYCINPVIKCNTSSQYSNLAA